MRLDDDTRPVRAAVTHLGTLIGDVAVLVILAPPQVYGICPHHHEGDEEHVACQVTYGVVRPLVGNLCDGTYLVDGKGTLPNILVIACGVVEVERPLDIRLSFLIVVVVGTGLTEHMLDGHAVVGAFHIPLRQPLLVL